MLARCRCEKSADDAAERENRADNIIFLCLFRFDSKGARLRGFSARAKPDVVNFGRFTGFFQLDQLVIDRFQQGRFAFLHADANLFFAQQVGDDFEVCLVRRFRQQSGEDGAVPVMACTLPLRRAVSASGISS